MEASALTARARAAAIAGRSPLLRLQSDERLIELTRRGNDHAFEALVRRYEARLLAFCRHMLGSREDAEDVLQEVFAAAYNALVADERPINARPWLYRIARNRCLNHLRRPQAQAHESMEVFDRTDGASAADTVVEREEFRHVLADVQELPETQRTALLLREIDALSYEQIAEAMETTVPSVKSLLVRARMALAEAAEARTLTCDEVRVALAREAEGLEALPAAVRRHLRRCERCRAFRSHLKETSKMLAAALLPAGPLFALKQFVVGKLLGGGAASGGAAGSAAASGAASACGAGGVACSAGASAVTAAGAAAGASAGAAGVGAAAGGMATSAISAGISTFASKAAAATAAAAVVAAGAIEIGHGTRTATNNKSAAPVAERAARDHAGHRSADGKAQVASEAVTAPAASADTTARTAQPALPAAAQAAPRTAVADPPLSPAATAPPAPPAPPVVERIHDVVTLPPEPGPPPTVTIEQPPVATGSAGDSQYGTEPPADATAPGGQGQPASDQQPPAGSATPLGSSTQSGSTQPSGSTSDSGQASSSAAGSGAASSAGGTGAPSGGAATAGSGFGTQPPGAIAP